MNISIDKHAHSCQWEQGFEHYGEGNYIEPITTAILLLFVNENPIEVNERFICMKR